MANLIVRAMLTIALVFALAGSMRPLHAQQGIRTFIYYPTTAGTAGQCWISSGAGVAPSWASCGAQGVQGTAYGGTGSNTTATSGRYLKGNGSVWITSTGSASGTGACAANSWASTLNSDSAPTCTQPAASNLSNGTTGSGSVVLATTPTLITPVLGVATATSVNKVALTAPATAATLTIADNKTVTVNNTLTLAGTDSTTMTFPTTSATIARTDAANTFTGHQTVEGVTSTGATGTGALVFATTPTLVTPVLGVATATSVNKVALTAPASAATLTIANNKTMTVNNTLTLAGTDSTTMTFPTTSATIARTDAANTFTGHQTLEGVTSTGATGTGNLVFDTSPTLVTPTIGVATATSVNKVALTAPATAATLTIANNKTVTVNNTLTLAGTDSTTMTFPATTGTVCASGNACSVSSVNFGGTTLSTYTEGTWTPVMQGGSVAGSTTHTTQNGRYTRIGRVVHAEAEIVWTAATGTGALTVTGFPFAAAQNVPCATQVSSMTYSNQFVFQMVATGSFGYLWQSGGTGGAEAQVVVDSAATLRFQCTYSI